MLKFRNQRYILTKIFEHIIEVLFFGKDGEYLSITTKKLNLLSLCIKRMQKNILSGTLIYHIK